MAKKSEKQAPDVAPVYRLCDDLLDFVEQELLELIPEWHLAERDQLAAKAAALRERLIELRNRPYGDG